MTLSSEEVFHLAELARIEIVAGEVDQFRGQIQSILGYVDRLAQVDTSSVTHVEMTALQGAPALDVAAPVSAYVRRALIQGFPDRLGDLLRVPGVFEHPKKS